MDVSGKTKTVGIFGYPVEHTLSPMMHNTAFKALGIDMCYSAFSVAPEHLPDAIKAIKALHFLGVNITVPHKEKVIPLLDKIDSEASFINAVNTIVNKHGKLTGYNTDGRGFMKSLSEKGISVTGKNIFVAGAGGASRAISYYLSEKASKLFLYDINQPKAKKLVNDLGKIRKNVFLIKNIKDLDKPYVIINATPLGLRPADPLPVSPDFITSDMVVYDLIYRNTKFLQEAKKKGAKTIDGSGMLLWQGVLAFEMWTGVKAPVDIMRKALMAGIKKSV
jgi:shikimate dehydrogenase